MNEPMFVVQTYGEQEETGASAGTLVEVMTDEGTVTIRTGPDGKTHISFANMPYRVVDHCVILGEQSQYH